MANSIKSCPQIHQEAEGTRVRSKKEVIDYVLLKEQSLYCGEDENQTRMVHAYCVCLNETVIVR